MNAIEIIEKKKRNEILTSEEIKFFVEGYVDGSIKDYQMSSLLMAICINHLNTEELAQLTQSYIDSGDVIDFKGKFKHVADKHSTGGVGDKTSLIIGPLVASCGIVMAKMSGRGLGHTGGTVDKLESIDGFQVEISEDEFMEYAEKNKLCIIGQTKNLVVADKKIYALRDVSGTVDSIGLIAASIMSKKLASGADSIVLDVKVGKGAIMSTYEESLQLAQTMVDIGKSHGKKCYAVLSDMNQPLGRTIGNKLEVIEAYKFLNGEYCEDLYEVSIVIAAKLVSACLEISIEEANSMVLEKLNNKEALKSFEDFITTQGGDFDGFEKDYYDVEVENVINIYAEETGYITEIDALKIANLARDLGAGRFVKEDIIDNNVGIILEKKVNDSVEKGDLIAKVFANKCEIKDVETKALAAFSYGKNINSEIKVIYNEI